MPLKKLTKVWFGRCVNPFGKKNHKDEDLRRVNDNQVSDDEIEAFLPESKLKKLKTQCLETQALVKDFFQRDNNIRIIPGMKDFVFVETKFIQLRTAYCVLAESSGTHTECE